MRACTRKLISGYRAGNKNNGRVKHTAAGRKKRTELARAWKIALKDRRVRGKR